jgi:lycopene beta-cyclase
MSNIQNSYSYDYIFAGGGMAALSLAYYLNNSTLKHKSILIIDRESKNTNDHTFCFWEKGDSPFEEIVSQKWNEVWFHGTNNFSELLDLDDLNYKMIKGIDFYEFINKKLAKNPNIAFLKADILEIEGNDKSTVKTSKGDFYADELIFDSVFRPKYNNPKYNNLMQHFKGWVIETTESVFNITQPTLFDFRIAQKNELRFVYILPFSSTKALIEFTIFSDNLLNSDEYDNYLKSYIKNNLKLNDYSIKTSEYSISETEFGIVPMSDEPPNIWPAKKILRIGTAGGFVKSSTGYSFQRTQIYLQNLVKALEIKNFPINSINNNNWKSFLDSVMLNVMVKNSTPQDELFTALFQKNKASDVLKFLSEQTTLWQDVKLMNTVPKIPFIKSAIREIIAKFI